MVVRRIKSAWLGYLDLWNSLTGIKLFLFFLLHYTILFALYWTGICFVLNWWGKSFMWHQDGVPQSFVKELLYLSQTARNSIQDLLKGRGWTFPLYDFRRGIIKSTLELEPVQLMAIFWPWNKIDSLYDILAGVRYYLIGVSFSVLGFYFKQNVTSVLIGAVSYVFCGYTLFNGLMVPYYLAPVIFLPILIVGAEKVLRGERGWLFAGVVFLSLVTSLYYSCILAVLVSIFILVRYFCDYHKNGICGFLRMIKNMALWGGLGILSSAVVWVPSLSMMVGSGRIGRVPGVMSKYPVAHYLNTLTEFIMVPRLTFDGSVPWQGFSVLAVPAVFLLLFDNRKSIKSLKVLFLICVGMVCVPAVNFVLSGFTAYYPRWTFGYALCIAAILMVELPRLRTADRSLLASVGGGVVIYIILCYFVSSEGYYHKTPSVLLLCSCAALAACYLAGRRAVSKILSLCLAITCLSVSCSIYKNYSLMRSALTDAGGAYASLKQGQYDSISRVKQVREDHSFYHVLGNDIQRDEINGSYYNNLSGLSFFTQFIRNSYFVLKDGLEAAQRRRSNLDYGLDGRAIVMSLANVKYYAVRKTGREILPYGMKKIGRIKKGQNTDIILENPYALSVGYTYDTWQSEKDLMSIPAAGRPDAMLRSVVLTDAVVPESVPQKRPENTARNIPMTILKTDGVSWKDGKLEVAKNKATIKLGFNAPSDAEVYLRVVNLDLTDGLSTRNWTLRVDAGKRRTSTKFCADGDIYSTGAKTQLINLGVFPKGSKTCTVTFPKKGTYILDGLEIWCQPMDRYADQVKTLRAEKLENVETNWRGLTGTISVSKDKVLVFSIPHDLGWSAYVDGKKTHLYRANIGFMGVKIPAGSHVVELKYWPLELTIGIVLTLCGFASVVIILVYGKCKSNLGPHVI